MPLQLNSIPDSIVAANVARDRERCKLFLEASNDSPVRSDPIRYARRSADTFLNLALGLYQQEGDLFEIQKLLDRCAQSLLTAFTLKSLSPLEFATALSLSTCFSPRNNLLNAAAVPEIHFYDLRSYENADASFVAAGGGDHLRFFEILARYLNILREFLATGLLDLQVLTSLETDCVKSVHGPHDTQTNHAKILGLKALVDQNQGRLHQAISTLLKAHQLQATQGDYRNSLKAFICFPRVDVRAFWKIAEHAVSNNFPVSAA